MVELRPVLDFMPTAAEPAHASYNAQKRSYATLNSDPNLHTDGKRSDPPVQGIGLGLNKRRLIDAAHNFYISYRRDAPGGCVAFSEIDSGFDNGAGGDGNELVFMNEHIEDEVLLGYPFDNATFDDEVDGGSIDDYASGADSDDYDPGDVTTDSSIVDDILRAFQRDLHIGKDPTNVFSSTGCTIREKFDVLWDEVRRSLGIEPEVWFSAPIILCIIVDYQAGYFPQTSPCYLRNNG